MKTRIYLNPVNKNAIDLTGTLKDFREGSSGSTIVLIGGENNKRLRGLFSEIIEGEKKTEILGVIDGSKCILEEGGVESLYFPNPVRVQIGAEGD